MKKSLFISLLVLSACDLPDQFQTFHKPFPEDAVAECQQQNPGLSREDCDIQACLSNPRTLLGMKKLLEDVSDVLEKMGIRYWLDGATLFGALRFHTPIPWDDDVDFAVLATEFESRSEEFRAQIMRKGYLMVPHYGDARGTIAGLFGGKEAFWQVEFSKEHYKQFLLELNPNLTSEHVYRYQNQNHLALDLFMMDEENNEFIYRAAQWQTKSGGGIPKNYVFDNGQTRQETILGKQYPVPVKYNEYANVLYGTSDIVPDVVIQTPHGTSQCNKKIRYRDIKQQKKLLNYFCDYLKHVFQSDFTGNFNLLQHTCS